MTVFSGSADTGGDIEVQGAHLRALIELIPRPATVYGPSGALRLQNAASAALSPATRCAGNSTFEFVVRGEQLTLVVQGEATPRLEIERLGLSPSLHRVADGICRGLADKEIAVELDLSLLTVRTYVHRIFRRLGVTSRTQLMGLAIA
jgi:DNA-binding NarL/FixJ family response regulator